MALIVLLESCSSLPLRERIGAPAAVLLLLLFLGIGIDSVIRPTRHMNAYLRRGGDMLRAWNEMQVRAVGILFSGFAAWMLYELTGAIWSKCFA